MYIFGNCYVSLRTRKTCGRRKFLLFVFRACFNDFLNRGGLGKLLFRLFFKGFFQYRGFALVSFDYGVSHYAGDELDGADSVVVAGDYVIDEVGIAVGIGDGDYGNVELAGFGYGDILVMRVNYFPLSSIFSSLTILSMRERMVLKLVSVPPSQREFT